MLFLCEEIRRKIDVWWYACACGEYNIFEQCWDYDLCLPCSKSIDTFIETFLCKWII